MSDAMKSRFFAVLGVWMLSGVPAAFAQGDAEAGGIVFTQKCATCHTMSVDPAHSPKGPNLMGVIGRPAGSIPGWDFSPALRASGLEFHPRGREYLVWTEQNLDKWLADPAFFVPGSRMDAKLPNPTERANVIAYMRSAMKLAEQDRR